MSADASVLKVGPIKPVVEEGNVYNPEKQRDIVRTYTTFGFIFLFGLTVLAAFYVVIWRGSEWLQTKELIQLMLPAETALIGSAVGFYFGSKSATSDHS
jgi:hypothetical protein